MNGNIQLYTEQVVEWYQRRILTEESERESVFKINIDGEALEIALERIITSMGGLKRERDYRLVPFAPNIIKRLDEFPNLQELIITGTVIPYVPSQLGNLRNLRVLILSDNEVQEIPEEIGNLTNLRELDISTNQLLTVPQSITKLTSLENFYYYDNAIANLESHLWNRLPASVLEFFLRFPQPLWAPPPTQLPKGRSFEVHRAFEKINKDVLINFIKPYVKEGNIRTYTSLSDREFKHYIKSNLKDFISKINDENSRKTNSKRDLEHIFSEILDNLQYNDKYKELIAYSLEYVKKQPKEFQQTYVSTFTYDCAHAYNRGNASIGCAKGMLERFVTNLVPAALAVKSNNNSVFEKNKYAELISIIESKTIRNLINDYTRDCSRENTINSNEKLIDCVKQKFGNKLTSSIISQIETYIPTLNLYGGRRRYSKTRKVRKVKKG